MKSGPKIKSKPNKLFDLNPHIPADLHLRLDNPLVEEVHKHAPCTLRGKVLPNPLIYSAESAETVVEQKFSFSCGTSDSGSASTERNVETDLTLRLHPINNSGQSYNFSDNFSKSYSHESMYLYPAKKLKNDSDISLDAISLGGYDFGDSRSVNSDYENPYYVLSIDVADNIKVEIVGQTSENDAVLDPCVRYGNFCPSLTRQRSLGSAVDKL
jgi:hypothetical protein